MSKREKGTPGSSDQKMSKKRNNNYPVLTSISCVHNLKCHTADHKYELLSF